MVNTKTTLSKKVLAVVLAVACMIAFTPAIAFTQSANAGTGTQTVQGNLNFDGTVTAQDIQDAINTTTADQPNTVTKSGNAYTVTLDAPTAGATKTITIAKGCSVVINMGSYSYSNAGAISLGGSLTINGTGTFTGPATTGTVHAIDGTADVTALTIGEGATFVGDIDLATVPPTAAVTATINGTVTGDVTLASTGTITGSGNISGAAKVGATSVKTAAIVTIARTDGGTLSAATTGTELTAGMNPTTGTYTYQWYRTVSGTKTAISGATGSTYVLTDTDLGNAVSVVVKEANKFGSVTDSTTPAKAAKPAVTTQPTDQDVASGATPADMSAVFSNATSYQWYATTSANNTGGTKITGANASTYGVASGYLSSTLKFNKLTSSFTKTYYYCEATNTAGTTASNAAYVALAAFGFTTQPESANVAVGATKALSVATTPTASSYTWYLATKADLSDARTQGTGAAYNFTSATKGTYYVYCVAKYGDTSIQSSTATMTVSDVAITTQPTDTELLKNDTANVSFESNKTIASPDTATWYYNDKNSTSGAAAAATAIGTESTTLTKSTLAVSGSSVYSKLGSKNGSLCVFAKYVVGSTTYTTNIVKVSIVDPAIATQPTDVLTQPSTVTPVSFKVNGSNALRSDVTWNYSTNADMSNATTWATGSSQAPTTLTAPAKAGTYYYQASFTVDSVTYKTDIAKMTVADLAFTTQPASKTVAAGQDVVLKAAINNTENAKAIKWYSSTSATVPTTSVQLAAAVLAGTVKDTTETGMTFAPDTATAGTYYYFATTGTGANMLFTTMATVTVTKGEKPAISTQPKSQDVASGAVPADMTVASTGTNTYQWYATSSAGNTGGTKITGANAATYGVASGYLSNTLKFSKITSTFTKTYYYCEVTNAAGTTASNAAYVALAAFGFTTQPESATVAVNTDKVLTAETTPTADSYTWYEATKSDLSDARTKTTGGTFTFNEAVKGTYYVYCVAKYGDTSLQSSTATMTVGDLAITTQPKDITFNTLETATADVTFAVNDGTVAANVQWYYNDAASTIGAAKVTTAAVGNVSVVKGVATLAVNPNGTAFGTTAAKKTIYVYATYGTGATMLTTGFSKISFEDAVIKTQPKDSMLYPSQNYLDVSFAMNGQNSALSGVTWSYSKNSDMSEATAWANAGSKQTIASGAKAPATEGTYYYQASFTLNGKTVKTDVAKMTVAKLAFTTQPAATKTVAVGQDLALRAAINNTVDGINIYWYKSTIATVPTTKAEFNLEELAGTITMVASGASLAPDTTAAGTYYYFASSGAAGVPIFTTMATVTVTPLAKNAKFTAGSLKYKVSSAKVDGGNVHVYAPKSTKYKSVTVPGTITKDGATYKVTGINSKSFAKAKKLKTITIKSLTLTKAGVKNSLKSSKVTTVKVPKSKYKTYKTYFTKKNCGKKVTVKKF